MTPALSLRQREILAQMHKQADSDDGELVYERGVGYLGLDRVGGRTVFALLRFCAISLEPYSEIGEVERYRINETGRKLLETKP